MLILITLYQIIEFNANISTLSRRIRDLSSSLHFNLPFTEYLLKKGLVDHKVNNAIPQSLQREHNRGKNIKEERRLSGVQECVHAIHGRWDPGDEIRGEEEERYARIGHGCAIGRAEVAVVLPDSQERNEHRFQDCTVA